MIDIKFGETHTDCTSEYFITTDCKTVGDFINEVLRENKHEWGYFGIYDSKVFSVFGNPKCEYRYGEIITEPLPQKFLDKEIKQVFGSGGWSRSDYLFVVERSEE